MQNGAEAIYVPKNEETLRDFEVLNNHLPDYGSRKLLISRNENLENSLISTLYHFGCIRYNEYGRINLKFNYSLCSLDYPSIISTLVSYNKEENNDYKCDCLAPIITLQIGLFTNIQLFGSVFYKDAFWCLPLESDFESVQWQTIVQYVQWMMGGRIAIFHGKNTLSTSKIKTEVVDEQFIKQLRAIKCNDTDEINTYRCVRKILQAMFQWKILSIKSNKVLIKWFFILEQYLQLYIKGSNDKEQCLPNKVLYEPFYREVPKNRTVWTASTYVANIQNKLQTICKDYISAKSLKNITKMMEDNNKQFSDILLIVTFNNALYNVIPYVEILFRSFFPHILYCGPEKPLNIVNISFISYGSNLPGHLHGSFSYECSILAYNMFPYMPGGYLFFSDDVLVLPHFLLSLPIDKIWFVPRSIQYYYYIVDLEQKCPISNPIRLGKCDNKIWVAQPTRRFWFSDYFNQTKTMLLEFHRKARQSEIFEK